jgi:hypothetical protein
MYLYDRLCDEALAVRLDRPGSAWGPEYALDAVAALRHAAAARRARRIRDLVLLAALAATAGALACRLLARHGVATGAVLAAVVAGAWGAVRHYHLTVRGVAGWIHGRVRRNWRRAGRYLAVAVALGTGAVLLVARERGLRTDLTILGAGIAVSWLLAAAWHYRTHLRMIAVRDAWRPPAELAAPLPDGVEERVRRLDGTNVIVYSGDRAEQPFVGSGSRLRAWKLEIDVLRGAPDGEGTRRVPAPVDLVALHRFLDDAFILERSVESSFGHRLYAHGRYLRHAPDLLVDRYGPPVQTVPDDRVLHEVGRPSDGDHLRTYFCLQEVCRAGEVVVCVFVRPRLTGALLFVENVLCALLPPDPDLMHNVARLTDRRIDLARLSMRWATRNWSRLVLGSPRRCGSDAAVLAGRRRWARAVRRTVDRNGPIDLGAVRTLREAIAVREPNKLDHYAYMDVVSSAAYLQHRLLNVIRRFLADHDIDTRDLDKARDTIITNIQNWTVGDVSTTGILGMGSGLTFHSGSGDDAWGGAEPGRPGDPDGRGGAEPPGETRG